MAKAIALLLLVISVYAVLARPSSTNIDRQELKQLRELNDALRYKLEYLEDNPELTDSLLIPSKRNSEVITSLLNLPMHMAKAG